MATTIAALYPDTDHALEGSRRLLAEHGVRQAHTRFVTPTTAADALVHTRDGADQVDHPLYQRLITEGGVVLLVAVESSMANAVATTLAPDATEIVQTLDRFRVEPGETAAQLLPPIGPDGTPMEATDLT